MGVLLSKEESLEEQYESLLTSLESELDSLRGISLTIFSISFGGLLGLSLSFFVYFLTKTIEIIYNPTFVFYLVSAILFGLLSLFLFLSLYQPFRRLQKLIIEQEKIVKNFGGIERQLKIEEKEAIKDAFKNNKT
jgi:hypothetical protein